MAQLFEALPSNDLPAVPDYNVCPTQTVHAVVATVRSRRLRALRWGFLPRWAKTPSDGPLLINARAETIAEKPVFREAARQRRCLIPATGFYEWTKEASGARVPWYIHPADDGPLAFAGVWQDWTGPDGETIGTCAIVTCAANATLAALHSRMPVVVEAPDWPLWLGEAGRGAATLMRPAPAGRLTFHRVDPAVNSNRASGPDLIAPLAA